MKYNLFTAYAVSFLVAIFLAASCSDLTGNNEDDITDTLEPVEEVTQISGAERSTMKVDRSANSYFRLEFSAIESNETINNGHQGEGWCIDWEKPIDSNGDIYNDVPLYSTFNVEKWNELNYLLNIKGDLIEADPDITFLEIQLAVWSLRGLPEFNLDAIALEDLPSRFRNNGQPLFDEQKVNNILQTVSEGYEDFDFVEGTKFAVIAETPSDIQTVITVVE
ncbi:MAG: hypothetical protein GVY08_10520 [Bacteroidetes bacterium]|jgi:hypothetical protein|nr:hypothetical protein [Bacteroidota bacterium]